MRIEYNDEISEDLDLAKEELESISVALNNVLIDAKKFHKSLPIERKLNTIGTELNIETDKNKHFRIEVEFDFAGSVIYFNQLRRVTESEWADYQIDLVLRKDGILIHA